VTSVLGSGGFATVYQTWQVAVGRETAVKVDSRVLHTERDRRRFFREVTAAGQLSGHPHVVDVYDAGTLRDGRPYMVMELCPGGSLNDELRRSGPISAERACRIGADLADALAAAHAAGILHRDLKPANILVNRYGVVGIADFGLASIIAANDDSCPGYGRLRRGPAVDGSPRNGPHPQHPPVTNCARQDRRTAPAHRRRARHRRRHRPGARHLQELPPLPRSATALQGPRPAHGAGVEVGPVPRLRLATVAARPRARTAVSRDTGTMSAAPSTPGSKRAVAAPYEVQGRPHAPKKYLTRAQATARRARMSTRERRAAPRSDPGPAREHVHGTRQTPPPGTRGGTRRFHRTPRHPAPTGTRPPAP
jgi:serine/threonine protein kinase